MSFQCRHQIPPPNSHYFTAHGYRDQCICRFLAWHSCYTLLPSSCFRLFLFWSPAADPRNIWESGQYGGSRKSAHSIKYPGLLYKPIRVSTIPEREHRHDENRISRVRPKRIWKKVWTGNAHEEAKGPLLAEGMLSMQKNDIARPRAYPDRPSVRDYPTRKIKPRHSFSICSIMMTKREFRAAKDFLQEGKGAKTYYSADSRPDPNKLRNTFRPDPGGR